MRILLLIYLLTAGVLAIAKPNPQQKLKLYQELAAERLISQAEYRHHQLRLQSQLTVQSKHQKAGTAAISGTVSAGASPLSGVTVRLFNADWQYIDYASTDAVGDYIFTALDPGDYIVSTNSSVDIYIDAIWTGTGTEFCQYCEPPTNAVISLSTGQISANHDMSLTEGATLTGLMVDSTTGLEVDSLDVRLYRSDGVYSNWHSSTQLNGTGQYTLSGIPAGQYRVYLDADYFYQTNNHIPELYNNIQCNLCGSLAYDGMGDLVNLVNGVTRTGIDFSLQTGASVSGNLVNSIGVAALSEDGLVYLFDVSNQVIATVIVEGTNTDPFANGSFTIGGLLPGSYFAQGGDWGREFFVRQLYNSKECPWSGCDRGGGGTPINLGPGEHRVGVNFLLQYGGKISGTVIDDSTGLPINSDDQWIQFYDSTGAVVGGGFIDPLTGDYISARAIPAGTYSARTGSMFHGRFIPGYVMEKYDPLGNIDCPGISCDLTAVNIVVNAFNPASGPDPAADATTGGIDFALDSGYSFSGTINDLSTLSPLADVHVLVYDDMGEFAHWSTTDINGDFTVSGLPAGTYYAKTNNGSNLPFMGLRPTAVGTWVDILYENLSCPGSACDVTTGTAIILGGSPDAGLMGTAQYDFELPNGGSLSGRLIHSETTVGLTNTVVNIYNSNGDFNGGFETDGEGYWRSSGLPSDTYFLTTQGIGGMVDIKFGGDYCFNGQCDPLTADPIPLAGQYNITGLNMILKPDLVFRSGMD